MSDSAPIPDDVPIADATEQRQPAVASPADSADARPDDGGTPLEADPGDWQEQRHIVDDPDADDERR